MKISLNWIKDYVTPGVPVDQLVARLTMAGIEVEKIEKAGTDTVVEFEITPNRPDCLSMIGMAREIAAALDKPLTLPKIKSKTFLKKKCEIEISAPEACPRYVGTVIEGARILQASAKLQKRLAALGNRPISNVVDVTNFCLAETGQPLHAFDFDKLAGGKIVVRFARDGETLVTLDGVERALDPSVLVIADAEKPVALAGIMGGANSEVTSATKNILLESAAFDPVLIRRTSRKLGLSSDSSYRFERGVFWDNVLFGADRALDLMLEEAGGRVTARTDTGAGRVSSRRRPVVLDLEKMNAFLGGKVSAAQVKKIFKALGLAVSSGKPGRFEVVPPDFRPDVIQPEDLYEEVARIIGYDNLPSSFPTVQLTGVRSNPDRAQRLKIADLLLSQGFNEVLTYSLVSGDLVREAGFKTLPRVSVCNPLSREQDALRPHLLPSFLQVAATNLNRGQRDLALFETGKVYLPGGEQEALGLILCGCLRSDWREPKARPFDFYDMKGAVERTLSQLKLGPASFSAGSQPFFEDGQQADVAVGKMPLGSLGKVSSDVLDRFGIKADNVFFAQLDLEKIYRLPKKPVRYVPAPEFPSITRDVSIAVDGKVAFEAVCAVVREFGSEHLKQIDFKEEYLGEKIPAGQRGLVFSVIYQSSQRTLTEGEIQTVHDAVCQKLQERLGAVVR